MTSFSFKVFFPESTLFHMAPKNILRIETNDSSQSRCDSQGVSASAHQNSWPPHVIDVLAGMPPLECTQPVD